MWNCRLYLFCWKSISHPRDYDKLTTIKKDFSTFHSILILTITSNKYFLKCINPPHYKNRMSYKNTSIHNKVNFLKFRTFHTLREMWLKFQQPLRESYIYCNCKKKLVLTNNELKQPQGVSQSPQGMLPCCIFM